MLMTALFATLSYLLRGLACVTVSHTLPSNGDTAYRPKLRPI